MMSCMPLDHLKLAASVCKVDCMLVEVADCPAVSRRDCGLPCIYQSFN